MGLIRQFVFDSLALVSVVVSFVGYSSIAAQWAKGLAAKPEPWVRVHPGRQRWLMMGALQAPTNISQTSRI